MSERLKGNLLKYGISALVCGGLVWFYVAQRNFAAQELMEKYRILCDAFTVPGLLLLMFGLLLVISNEGAFDGIGYALSVAWKALIPGGRTKMEKYFDYVERRRSKKVKGIGFLFVVGGVCMAAALVFMVLFYQLYGK